MKPWMRILMWFGLGTALGYCAGKQVGYRKGKTENQYLIDKSYHQGRADGQLLVSEELNEFNKIASQYRATPLSPEDIQFIQERVKNRDIQQPVIYERHELTKEDIKDIETWPPDSALIGHRATNAESSMTDIQDYPEIDDKIVSIPRQVELAKETAKKWEPEEPYPDDEPEMPMDEPAIDDLDNLEASYNTALDDPMNPKQSDIPPFHPTFTIPQIVSEEEYDKCGDLDEKTLIYYEGDDVLYCCEDRRPIGEDEQPALIGIGTLEGFRAGPGEPKDELYVVNETYGRFKIIRMDDAFADAVDGTCAPDDEDDDDDI